MDLRTKILRPGQPVELCRYAEDDLPTTFHLGILENNEVICNGTFMQQPSGHPLLQTARRPYRLRGMATAKSHQGKGYGREIILFAEYELQQRDCDLLWFNARVSAEGFYRKLGYTAIEDIFNIDSIGPHKIMYKLFAAREREKR